MASTKQSRSITKEVEVVTCDGPGCTVEHVYQDNFAHNTPDRWFTIIEHNPPFNYAGHKPEDGHLGIAVQFHSWRCLVGWMQLHLLAPDQINFPLGGEPTP